jgi:large subunit ribosomal protein L22
MKAHAEAKMLRISPQKATLVARLIRYKSIEDAIAILQNTDRKSGALILNVLNSAIANAVENHGMLAENLIVSEAIANEGPTMKR